MKNNKEIRAKSSASKACIGCHIVKPLSEYYHDKTQKDGLRRRCIDCIKLQSKKIPASDPNLKLDLRIDDHFIQLIMNRGTYKKRAEMKKNLSSLKYLVLSGKSIPEMAEKLGKSSVWVFRMLREIVNAHKEGYTNMGRYIDEGRKASPQRRNLLDAKNK